jgi:hypothetical protein
MSEAPFDPTVPPICLRTRFAIERRTPLPLHMTPVYEADQVTGALKFTGDFVRTAALLNREEPPR